MMGVNMKILLSVHFIMKNLVRKRTIIFVRDKNVEKGKATINIRFHGEFYGSWLIIKMLKKQI